jgi:hypothetical protein
MEGIDATTPKFYNNSVIITVFRVLHHPEAEAELDRLPAPERVVRVQAGAPGEPSTGSSEGLS